MNPTELEKTKALLKANGFIVTTAKSYYAAQQRYRDADVATGLATGDRDSQREWMEQEIFPELRKLHDRLAFVHGVARARGATVQEPGGSIDRPNDAPSIIVPFIDASSPKECLLDRHEGLQGDHIGVARD